MLDVDDHVFAAALLLVGLALAALCLSVGEVSAARADCPPHGYRYAGRCVVPPNPPR